MYSKEFTKKLMDFNKTIFDSTFNTMTNLFDQTESNFFRFLEKSQWISEDGKKMINELAKAYKKNREYFKEHADDNYKRITDYFAQLEKEEMQKNDKK